MIEQYSRAKLHTHTHNRLYENRLMANNRGKNIYNATSEIENMMTIISNQLFIFSSAEFRI